MKQPEILMVFLLADLGDFVARKGVIFDFVSFFFSDVYGLVCTDEQESLGHT